MNYYEILLASLDLNFHLVLYTVPVTSGCCILSFGTSFDPDKSETPLAPEANFLASSLSRYWVFTCCFSFSCGVSSLVFQFFPQPWRQLRCRWWDRQVSQPPLRLTPRDPVGSTAPASKITVLMSLQYKHYLLPVARLLCINTLLPYLLKSRQVPVAMIL